MIRLKSNQKYIQEYVRVMKTVDISDEMSKRIIDICSNTVVDRRTVKAPAIAAISCAAVAAVAAVGIPKIVRSSRRK